MVTIGITGQQGFIGTHLYHFLKLQKDVTLIVFSRSFFDDPSALRDFVSHCDVIVHLAGMNRGDDKELYDTNLTLAQKLLDALTHAHVTPHVIFSSSAHIDRDTPYGRSKKQCGELLLAWGKKTGALVSVLVIPNVYGEGCRPFYNSAVATFCYQLTHGETPVIHQDTSLSLISAFDLVRFVYSVVHDTSLVGVVSVTPTTTLPVSHLLGLLQDFTKLYLDQRIIPLLDTSFHVTLFNTFRSHIDDQSFPLPLYSDARGSLFEIVKLVQGGQVFFSTTRPGIVRGNHYHTRKIERFCVVQGKALIQMRHIGTRFVRDYTVSGESPTLVDIPVFYTHSITNIGEDNLLTLFWANEIFDAADPDTFPEVVVLS